MSAYCSSILFLFLASHVSLVLSLCMQVSPLVLPSCGRCGVRSRHRAPSPLSSVKLYLTVVQQINTYLYLIVVRKRDHCSECFYYYRNPLVFWFGLSHTGYPFVAAEAPTRPPLHPAEGAANGAEGRLACCKRAHGILRRSRVRYLRPLQTFFRSLLLCFTTEWGALSSAG